jgi:hypothetical protein
LRLAIRLQQRSVVTGGTLTVGIRTAARARNGRWRAEIAIAGWATRSVVAYRTALHGTADRHGRFVATS